MGPTLTNKELKDKIQTFQTFNGKVVTPWMRRAMTRPDIHTKDNESTRSASGEYKGKEILFPTIRMRGPGLEKMDVKKAIKEAIKKKDYIEFKSPKEATKFSKDFSDFLGRSR